MRGALTGPGLLLFAALLRSALAASPEAPPFAGELLRWEVRYTGLSVGTAWAEAKAEGQELVIEAGARNASWYEPIYVVNDLVRSTWSPGAGSRRYQTWFREGRFHQDQDMKLGPDAVEVWRRQLRDGAWSESTTRYDPAPLAEDPISAMYALRREEGDGPWTYVVWNGKKALSVVATAGPEETLETALGALQVRRVSLAVPHEGQVSQKGSFVVWLSADERRLPVRAVLDANVGSFRAELIEYRSPGGSAGAAPEAGEP